MGTLYADTRIENIVDRSKGVTIPNLLVDTRNGYSWLPSTILEEVGVQREKDVVFMMANDQKITRGVGFAIVRVDNVFTVDEVVFAEHGDLLRLGARSLEGLSLIVDSRKKKLIASGSLTEASILRATSRPKMGCLSVLFGLGVFLAFAASLDSVPAVHGSWANDGLGVLQNVVFPIYMHLFPPLLIPFYAWAIVHVSRRLNKLRFVGLAMLLVFLLSIWSGVHFISLFGD